MGGLQRDPHRFFQASLRPTESLIYYLPDEELEAHRTKRTIHGDTKKIIAADVFWARFCWNAAHIAITSEVWQSHGKKAATWMMRGASYEDTKQVLMKALRTRGRLPQRIRCNVYMYMCAYIIV